MGRSSQSCSRCTQSRESRVFLVTRRADGKLLACKTVKAGEDADREVQSLCLMQGNPGVIALHEIIYDNEHLVLELCACSLWDRVKRVGALVESEAAYLIKSLARTVQDLHSMRILHRDLKAENVLLTSEAPPYEVKICDLGLAADFTPGSCLNTGKISGTLGYLAPEARLGRYSEVVDVWGLGLILYEALSGFCAFSRLWSEEVLKAGDDVLVTLNWSKISGGAKTFILEMMNWDPGKRLTIKEVLEHPWIAQFEKTSKVSKKRKAETETLAAEEPRHKHKRMNGNSNWVIVETGIAVEEPRHKGRNGCWLIFRTPPPHHCTAWDLRHRTPHGTPDP